MSEVFSPYQIDYSVKNTSKTFGFSKKKIVFKFGIANPPAVANGENGANCRGSEHEIIFIWSLNSGKRQILCDGKDVHYSETGQNGWTADQVFQHHFQLRVAGLSGPLRAHLITQPANRDVPHIKPFDLRLNGVSYFSMPKIFQLGTPQMVVRPVKGKGKPGRGHSGGGERYNRNDDDAHLSPAERQAIAAAKIASMNEMHRGDGYGAPASAPVVEDLISFDAPAPAPQSAYGQPPPGHYGQPPPGQYGQPPPQQGGYSNYSLGAAPVPAAPPQQPGVTFAPTAPPPPQQFGAGGFTASLSTSQVFGGDRSHVSQQEGGSSMYGQAPQQLQTTQQGSFYGSMPPDAFNNSQNNSQQFNNLTSPAAKSVASYQSYGSAPAFAQPPQVQHQQAPPPQQQQYMQQQQQTQQGYYGQPPAHQGY